MSKILLNGLMLVGVLIGWLPAHLAQAASGAPEARMTATVIEFSVRGDLHEQAGAIMADLMMSALANTGRFTLKDRLALSAAAKIAKEQELGSTGLLDPKTAAELGRRYGVDAIVTGGVNKLGDLITVTARLIDTRTASLLRSGQIQGRDIDTIQIKVNELAAMITTPPEPSKTYRLTIKTQPVDASIRLLNSPIPYQPGVRLPPGNYEIEVGQAGYSASRKTITIDDQDVAVNIDLEKTRRGLTVRPEPADATVRLVGVPGAYQPGMQLAPGDYEIEVARDGYISRKVPVQIANSDLIVPVKLEKQPLPPPPEQYHLTVQTDPAQATIRLLNVKTPYQPGMELPPGEYTVEVSEDGYEPVKMPVKIINSDVTMPVKLVKQPEPAKPTLYRLTVRPNPSNAQIRIMNIKPRYEPGIALGPGRYIVEVSRAGYETQTLTVRVADADVTLPVTLIKEPEPEPEPSYRLTVRSDPADAQIRLLGIRPRYRPGIALNPGSYTVEVSRSGYQTQRLNVRVANADVTLPVTLIKEPEPVAPIPPPEPTTYRLTVRTDPSRARVRLVNSSLTYRPGVRLPPGEYTVEVSRDGYETKQVAVRVTNRAVTESVRLERIAVAPPPAPAPTPPRRAGGWPIGSVQIDGSITGVDRGEVQRVLNRYVGQTVNRRSLLQAAMQVYRTTGITLSFVVRNATSGSAVLEARLSQRLRRTYESSIPLVTPGQIERSGFGVSVQ
ncbi:MAG: PEGA domain-containing protein [Candidatus Competibacteraceae bacterium]|nr:PEGA domain-containing protein [Candidatus Competibacteraceae bacterium]